MSGKPSKRICLNAGGTITPSAAVIVSTATGWAYGRPAILNGSALDKSIDGRGRERSAEERKPFFRGISDVSLKLRLIKKFYHVTSIR